MGFDERVERWKRIKRGEEKFGEGTPHGQAIAYRFEHLLPLLAERARENSHRVVEQAGEVDLLISLSGFSPETTILAYEVLRPTRLVVITSAGARAGINRIHPWCVREGRLQPADFQHVECDPADPRSIYELVQREIAARPHDHHVVLDITGGKKVMSATGALAAWQLDLHLVYVDSDFDREFRQPEPGTEHLVLLGNPATLFGAEELARVRSIFDAGAFGIARDRYDELAERLAAPEEARFMRRLSELYRAWCALDPNAIQEAIDALSGLQGRGGQVLTGPQSEALEAQLAFLRRLAEAGTADAGEPVDRMPFLVNYCVLGRHYRRLGRHDFAALLFYRTIEGVLTHRLELLGLDPRRPDYTCLGVPVDELTERFMKLATEIRLVAVDGLPPWLTFTTAAALLHVLDDPLLRRAGVKTPKAVNHLRQLGDTRNQSVLAHGYSPSNRSRVGLRSRSRRATRAA